MVKNGDFTFLPLEIILVYQLADLPPSRSASGSEGQFQIFTVRDHIGRSTGTPTPQYWHVVVKNGNFRFLLLGIILAYQLADLPPLVDLPVDLKGNFRFLLLELILADQLAVLPLTRSASGSEGQFQLLLLRLILADQLAHLPPSTGM